MVELKVGDEFPTDVTSVTENDPHQQVDLAKELGKGKVIVFGVSGAVSTQQTNTLQHSTALLASATMQCVIRATAHSVMSSPPLLGLFVCLCVCVCVCLWCVVVQFTPGCSNTHLPSFLKDYEKIKSKGVDQIVCLSVNDAFVMHGRPFTLTHSLTHSLTPAHSTSGCNILRQA